MRLLTFVLPVLLAAACAERDPPVTTLSLDEVNYRVPDEHIVSVALEPHQLVRIKPPERNFELVYDSRTVGQTDRFGWPAIFSLNDERAPNIERHARGEDQWFWGVKADSPSACRSRRPRVTMPPCG